MSTEADDDPSNFDAHSSTARDPSRFWEIGDILLTLWTLATAMWQLLTIDKSMIGFVGFWMLPPILMIIVRFRAANKKTTRRLAMIYLAIMSLATLVAEQTSIFPDFRAEPGADTDFAERMNRLDVVSRGVIAVNMTMGGILIFAGLGYILFWRDLRADRRFRQPALSVPTCIFGLCVLWGMPLLALIVLLIELLTS